MTVNTKLKMMLNDTLFSNTLSCIMCKSKYPRGAECLKPPKSIPVHAPSVFYLSIHGIIQVSLQYTSLQPIEYTCPFGPLRHPFSLTLRHEHA